MTNLDTFPHPVVELQTSINQQQDLAVTLARDGDVDGARAARAKLYVLLNRADLLERMS
jgi:hypothetical protein